MLNKELSIIIQLLISLMLKGVSLTSEEMRKVYYQWKMST